MQQSFVECISHVPYEYSLHDDTSDKVDHQPGSDSVAQSDTLGPAACVCLFDNKEQPSEGSAFCCDLQDQLVNMHKTGLRCLSCVQVTAALEGSSRGVNLGVIAHKSLSLMTNPPGRAPFDFACCTIA